MKWDACLECSILHPIPWKRFGLLIAGLHLCMNCLAIASESLSFFICLFVTSSLVYLHFVHMVALFSALLSLSHSNSPHWDGIYDLLALSKHRLSFMKNLITFNYIFSSFDRRYCALVWVFIWFVDLWPILFDCGSCYSI